MTTSGEQEARAGWLVGGGEMAERIRSFDWSKTPLGPMDSWPQSLSTTVDIVLGSAFPTIVLWSRALIQI